MTATVCPIKHTKPQIPDADWRCPKCGTGANAAETFTIIDPAEGAAEDCILFHDDDGVYCEKCDYGDSGKAFARLYAKKQGLIPCPDCKGSGMVKAGR